VTLFACTNFSRCHTDASSMAPLLTVREPDGVSRSMPTPRALLAGGAFPGLYRPLTFSVVSQTPPTSDPCSEGELPHRFTSISELKRCGFTC